MKTHIGELAFFFALFAVVGYFTYMILSPFFTALFLAGVFAIMFSPLFGWFTRKCNGDRTWGALVTVIVVLLVVLVPLSFVGFLMFEELQSIYKNFNEGTTGLQIIDLWMRTIEHIVQRFIPGFTMDIDAFSYVRGLLAWAGQNFSVFFAGLFGFIFDIFLIIVAMFFLYRDGDKLKAFVLRWSPLADSYDESIIAKIELAVTSVVKGSLLTSSVQGILVGIGFALFGVSNPVFWGVVATIASFVPVVGTTLITVPAVVMLFLDGHVASSVGLLIWSVVCVGLSDNVLHPFFIKRGVRLHPLLILLSIFGGLNYFGPVGFLAGPVVLAFVFALLDIYPAIMKGRSIDTTTL